MAAVSGRHRAGVAALRRGSGTEYAEGLTGLVGHRPPPGAPHRRNSPRALRRVRRAVPAAVVPGQHTGCREGRPGGSRAAVGSAHGMCSSAVRNTLRGAWCTSLGLLRVPCHEEWTKSGCYNEA